MHIYRLIITQTFLSSSLFFFSFFLIYLQTLTAYSHYLHVVSTHPVCPHTLTLKHWHTQTHTHGHPSLVRCVSLPQAQHINLYNALKEKTFSHH